MIKNTIILILLIIILGLTFLLASVDTNKQEPVIDQEETPSTEEISTPDITGTWVSTQDPKSEVIYKEDGSTEEIYDQETLSTGTWEIYQDDSAQYNPSGFFLRTEINDETYEYAIISLENNILQLSYLDRGNTLEYKKIEEQ